MSAMAAAFSIISLVIFRAPCASAHNTPGNRVPPSPIAEQDFMKFRRSSIDFLQHSSRARAQFVCAGETLPTLFLVCLDLDYPHTWPAHGVRMHNSRAGEAAELMAPLGGGS